MRQAQRSGLKTRILLQNLWEFWLKRQRFRTWLIELMPFERDKDAFSVIRASNLSTWGFANSMLEHGNIVGGFSLDDAGTGSAINITFNSTFSSSPAVLMGWLDTYSDLQ